VGDKAIKEAKKVGIVNVAASTKAESYSRVPAQAELKLDPRRRLRAHDVEQHH